MSETFDAIVIGGGHNGLTAAAYLAKAGKKTLVVEAREQVGGLAGGSEFHPGYHHVGILHSTSLVRRRVIKELELPRHGLHVEREAADVFVPSTKNAGLLVQRDLKKAKQEFERHAPEDWDSYKSYRSFLKKVSSFVNRTFDSQPLDIYGSQVVGLWDLLMKASTLRLMGKKDMMELLRIGPMCVADWLDEWFRSDLLKVALASPAVHGSYAGPWSPSTNANLILNECLGETYLPEGPAGLIRSLVNVCNANKVVIKTGLRVTKINTDANNAVTGIRLSDGSEVSASRIISSCDPKQTLLELLPKSAIPPKLTDRITHFRTRGTCAKVHLALNKPFKLACRPEYTPEFVLTSENLDDLERSFDPIKYGEFAVVPSLDIHVPTVRSPSLAPEGHAVLSILVNYAPYDLRGGWTEEKKQELLQGVYAVLDKYAPGTSSAVVGAEVLSPKDLGDQFGLANGNLFHGEPAVDQLLVRPTPETSRYRTPVKGLFLGGSGSHPGGGITCAPGSLAAEPALQG